MTNKDKRALWKKAHEVADIYSNKERENNYAGETFELIRIKPLSDLNALVYYKKSPSGKLALAHFILIESKGWWFNYLLCQGHMVNLHMIPEAYQEVEQYNFDR